MSCVDDATQQNFLAQVVIIIKKDMNFSSWSNVCVNCWGRINKSNTFDKLYHWCLNLKSVWLFHFEWVLYWLWWGIKANLRAGIYNTDLITRRMFCFGTLWIEDMLQLCMKCSMCRLVEISRRIKTKRGRVIKKNRHTDSVLEGRFY